MLDGHASKIRADLDEASRLRTEAEAMLKDAQARREAALTEARSLLDSARSEAMRVAIKPARSRKHQASGANRWRWTGFPPPRRPPYPM